MSHWDTAQQLQILFIFHVQLIQNNLWPLCDDEKKKYIENTT